MLRVALLSFLLTFLSSLQLSAQGWFRTYDEFIEGHSIVRLHDGGYVISGRSGVPSGSAMDDASLLRVDIDGQVVWAKTYGGNTQRELAIALIQDTNGDLVATGSTNSFGSSADALLFKTDLQGNQLWMSAYGSNFESDRANKLIQTSDGGYLMTGCFDCTGNPQAFLVKTDVDGNGQWSKTYPVSQEGFTILQTPDGGYLLGAVTDNASENFIGGAVLIKTDVNGNQEWTQTYQGDYNYNVTVILPQPDGYLLAGASKMDLAEEPDIFLLKTSLTGDSLWTKTYGGAPEGDLCYDLKQRLDGSILIAGTTFNSRNGDYLIINTDAQGNTLWSRTYGSDLEETSKSIAESPDGRLAITGVSRARNMMGAVTVTKVLLMRLEPDGFMGQSYIHGQVFRDDIADCLPDPSEEGFPELIVEAIGSRTYYGTTDAQGRYAIPLPGGTYDVRVYAPDYWQNCQNPVTAVATQGILDSVEVNFGLQEQTNCPLLEVDVSTPLLRRGATSTYTVNYCNNGPSDLSTMAVEIDYDDDFSILSSSIPFTNLGNNRLLFQPPGLASTACGSFEINLLLNSSNTVDGETHCVEARISPDSICLPVNPSWEGYSLEVEGECKGDSTVLRIRNTSGINMTQSRQFIVIEDMIIERTNSFRLNGNEEMEVVVYPEGKTVRFEVDQASGHPGFSNPSVDIEACGLNGMGDFSRGLVTVFPEDDRNVFVSIDCQESVATFAAEEQKAYPKGKFADHLIEANTDIEYHIRWQNTSNDTIDRIVIRDTLSPFVLPTSLSPGSSSHSYAFDLYDDGIARFTFENIKLPPASINEAASHAYIKFRVSQQPNNPAGTVITNHAAVYFDGTAPMTVAPLFHTIERGIVYATQQQEICEGEAYAGVTVYSDTTLEQIIPLLTYDSVCIAELSVLAVSRYVEEANICDGDVYYFNNIAYSVQGFYTDTLGAANGCDSLSSLQLWVQESYSNIIDTSLCEGESIIFGGLTYNSTGTYAHPYSTANGCDSLQVLNLQVYEHTAETIDTTIQEGETYNDVYYSRDTILIDTLVNVQGCDSILTVNLIIETVGLPTVPEFDVLPEVHPNPVNGSFVIHYQLNTSSSLKIVLYNTLGQAIKTILQSDFKAAGQHRLFIEESLPNGTYLMHFQTATGSVSKKIIFVN